MDNNDINRLILFVKSIKHLHSHHIPSTCDRSPRLPGWVCAHSWCRRPWTSERWPTARRLPPQTRGCRRWSWDSSGCSPKNAEEGCSGGEGEKGVCNIAASDRWQLRWFIKRAQECWRHFIREQTEGSAVHGSNWDGEEVLFYFFFWLALNITISIQTDLSQNHCGSKKIIPKKTLIALFSLQQKKRSMSPVFDKN